MELFLVRHQRSGDRQHVGAGLKDICFTQVPTRAPPLPERSTREEERGGEERNVREKSEVKKKR